MILHAEPTRTCRKCGQQKPSSQFYKAKHGETLYYFNDCIECVNLSKRKVTGGTSKFIFPLRCGGCGKRLTNASQQRGFLCANCSKVAADRQKYIKIYEQILGSSVFSYSCVSCQFLNICNVRVKAGLWLVCEMPDQHDIERAALHNIITDGRQITLRKEQVGDLSIWPSEWPDEASIGEGQPLTLERVSVDNK